jgi:hypothetical protein
MKEIFNITVGAFITGMLTFMIFETTDHEKRLKHLESVTFESSRCPEPNKSFSLVNLGR